MELIIVVTFYTALTGLAAFGLFKLIPDSVYLKLENKIFGE
jgi:hypothetical protein